jgi:hypothetical protein
VVVSENFKYRFSYTIFVGARRRIRDRTVVGRRQRPGSKDMMLSRRNGI